ncbi:MAG: hypothetical protein ACLUOO_03040 [Coprococcus sp.]
MMRAFIKQQIVDGAKKNFALLIPTKALINEVTSELIESLTTLTERDRLPYCDILWLDGIRDEA